MLERETKHTKAIQSKSHSSPLDFNLVKMVCKIVGTQSPFSLQDIFGETVRKQGLKIAKDPSHILHKNYELMTSGRRYRLPCKLNRYKLSLVPLSIELLNSKKLCIVYVER